MIPITRPRPRAVAALVGLAAVLTACAGGADPTASPSSATGGDAEPLRVVVTTTILGDVVGELLGEDGALEVLMPAGADPHSFSPSAAQAASVRDADLVVANGLGLEESLVDLLAAAEGDGARVLELAPELDPLPFAAGDDGHAEDDDGHAEDDHGHDEGDLDPHVWFDPVRMADGAGILAAALAEVDTSLDDAEWERRGADLAARYVALDEELREILGVIPEDRRVLVTNHEAIGYLAQRYDLEVVGTVIPGGATLASADAGRIAELAELLRDAGVPAIFAENTTDDRLAQTLAREVGRAIEVVELYTDALGEAGSGAETYEGLLRTDARLIADALG